MSNNPNNAQRVSLPGGGPDGIRMGVCLLLLFFVVTLAVPASREMHILCIRLLLHLRSNTYVQGQPPGCILYTVPNVKFTKGFGADLRRDSNKSPEHYVRAAANSSYGDLTFPSADVWASHSLLLWAALHQKHFNFSDTETNAVQKRKRENISTLIQLAQSEHPDNGILWLAEAVHAFRDGNEKEAIAALETAVQKPAWSIDYKNSCIRLKGIVEDAGLSKLDAAISANNLSSDTAALMIVGSIKRGLYARMTSAVQEGDAKTFVNDLTLWTKLGERSWAEDYIPNRFRIFGASDELLNAMALKVGMEIPEFSTELFEERQKVKEKILLTYLSTHLGSNAAQTLLSRSQDAENAIQARRDATWENEDKKLLRSGAYASISGAFSLVVLASLATYGLLLLAFHAGASPSGEIFPRSRFWLFLFVSIGVSTWLIATAYIALGPEEIGFGPKPEDRLLNSEQSGWLIALVLTITPTISAMVLRKSLSESTKALCIRQLGYFLSYSYLILIVVSAYFRDDLVDKIAFGVFR